MVASHFLKTGAFALALMSAAAVAFAADPAARFQDASAAFQSGDYAACVKASRDVLDEAGSGPLASEARYLLAEALFQQKNYYDAYLEYERLLSENAETERLRRIVEREHQIASAFLAGHTRSVLGFRVSLADLGVEILTKIVRDYPYEDFSPEDQFRIGAWYFEKRRYLDAEDSFREVLIRFPRSEWSDEALFQLGLCRLLATRSLDYDATPLEDAKVSFREYILRYPDGALVQDAKARLREIQDKQAAQEFKVARFYLRQDKVGAARVYLESILREYPETDWAREASELLGRLGSK